MQTQLKQTGIAAACFASILLAGCGGGGSGDSGGGASGSSALTVAVRDGAIQGATVCLDKNNNGLCDTGEAQGTTGADGKATFSVLNAEANKYPILVVVPVGATDAGNAVTQPYALRAPMDAPTLVTPLTTLVQTQVESTGASTAQAASNVQQQLGIENSPLADFTQTGEKKARSIANAVVVTTQAQGERVKDALNTKTANNTTITQGDLDKLVAHKVAALLDQLVAKAIENAELETPARVAALTAAAEAILNTDGIQDASSATAAIDQTQQTVAPLPTAVADSWFETIRIGGAFDYFLSLLTYSAAENTADASGKLKFRYQTFKSYPGATPSDSVMQVWSGGWAEQPRDEAELHWTGSAWNTCGINAQHLRSVPDAKGNSSINLCDNQFTGSVNSTVVDISGKKMAEVVQVIKDQGYTNLTLADPGKLGSSVFASDAKLAYFTTSGQATLTPPAYNPGGWDWAYLPDEKLAQGDPATCKLSNPPDASPTATLEELIARVRGTPCINAQGTPTGKGGVKLDSGTRNDGWAAASLGLTTLGNAPTYSSVADASSFYTTNTPLRLAFTDGNGVNYYKCQQRWDGRPRNCDSIGKGSYTIETLGDAKVMKLSGLPTAFTNVKNWVPVFVERGGYVHFGYQTLPKPGRSARLNAVAANGLFAAMGVSKVIKPDALLALTAASYAAEYEGRITGTEGGAVGGTGDFWIKLTPGQAAVCRNYYSGDVSASNPNGQSGCNNFKLVPRAGDGTVADASFNPTTNPATTVSFTIDFYTGVISGGFAGSDATGSWKGTFTGQRD